MKIGENKLFSVIQGKEEYFPLCYVTLNIER